MLKEQEAGRSTTDVCRKRGVISATSYKHKAKYGGLGVSEARRLRALEEENGKLEKLFVGRVDAPLSRHRFTMPYWPVGNTIL